MAKKAGALGAKSETGTYRAVKSSAKAQAAIAKDDKPVVESFSLH